MKKMSRTFSTIVFLSALLLKSALGFALDFEVNNTVDELNFTECTLPAPKNCSLRTAILWSNQLVGVDTITLKPGIYPITRLGKEPMVNPETFNDFDIRDSVIIRGAGINKTIIDGMEKYRIFEIHDVLGQSQTVVFEDLNLRNGKIDQNSQINSGAAINAFNDGKGQSNDRDSLILRRVRVHNNTVDGSAVDSSALSFDGEILHIEDAELDHNQYIQPDEAHPSIALINISNPDGVSFQMKRTRIHDNHATNLDSCLIFITNFQNIWWDQDEISANNAKKQVCINSGSGTLLFSNSTFSGNGGQVISSSADLGLLHVTMVDNNLKNLSDNVIWSTGPGQLWIKNSIIANPNSDINCGGNKKVFSLGNNISSDDSCVLNQASDHPNTDPLLGPLQFNGGKSRTHMPLPQSLAVDGGETLAEVPVDQRGQKRPSGKAADIGAVERGVILSIAP